jgi:replicative DNA helicase
MPEERGRIPPHSLEAEEGLLGSCLIDPGADILSSCMEAGLKSESFFKPAHRVVYQVMQDLYAANSGVDEVTVLDALSSRSVGSIDWLKRQQRNTDPKTTLIQLVGGPSILIDLTNRIESIANARYWLDIVHQKWLLRRLIETASHIADEAYINQDQLEVFIGEAEQRILSIQEDRSGDSAQKFDVSIEDAGNLIQNILAGKQDSGVLTGYKDIDGMTFGLHSGQMIVLAARPSMGKTSLGMNSIQHGNARRAISHADALWTGQGQHAPGA